MENNASTEEIEAIARKIRGKIIDLTHKAKCAHLASAMSCADILATLYWKILNIDPKNPKDPDRDRFILSKGHAAMALYSTLAFKGFFPETSLDTFGEQGTIFAEHPDPAIPGIETATGSLGHGLSVGVGMALAGKIQKKNYKVFAVLSDGECNEGSTWEATMFAPAHKLDNVCAIVDFNKWQATSRSTEVLALEPLKEKWKSFGWSTYEIDGHDLSKLYDVLSKIPDGSGKPVAIIAHTVKGKGVSFMEDDNNWHYRVPDKEEVKKAKKELGLE
jgi:transketolase